MREREREREREEKRRDFSLCFFFSQPIVDQGWIILTAWIVINVHIWVYHCIFIGSLELEPTTSLSTATTREVGEYRSLKVKWVKMAFWNGGAGLAAVAPTIWVRCSASILYSSVADVLNWEISQITANNTAEYILIWVRFFCSQLYWVYTQPHFIQRYKRFHEMYKLHKMKCLHQRWCLVV